MIAIPIETRFSERDDLRLSDKRDDAIPIAGLGLGRVVRMNANRAADVVQLAAQLNRRATIFNSRADGEHRTNARLGSALKNLRQLRREARISEMAVRVDH